MKVSIEYLKTGHIETRDCSEITFAQGRMILESANQFSVFYPTDQVVITINESEKKQEFVNSENLLETHLAKLSQAEKLNEQNFCSHNGEDGVWCRGCGAVLVQ